MFNKGVMCILHWDKPGARMNLGFPGKTWIIKGQYVSLPITFRHFLVIVQR